MIAVTAELSGGRANDTPCAVCKLQRLHRLRSRNMMAVAGVDDARERHLHVLLECASRSMHGQGEKNDEAMVEY